MEFNNLNEAEKFINGKQSGKVLNFTDFIFENVKQQSTMTDVVFYIDKDGQTLAYFPNDDADNKGNKTCYAHVGQHSACNPDYVKDLKKATPEEYKDLQAELVGQGYDDLNVLSENLLEDNSENGYGQQAFYFAKNGDTNNYFFKIQTGQDKNGFVVSIGKFSKFTQPTEQKLEYGVISITKLDDEELDQAVVDQGKFNTNTNEIDTNDALIEKLLTHLALIIEDYVQKNPKVSKFYDEMQSNLRVADYDNKFAVSLDKWPGGNEAWKLQTMEKGKMNIISK